MTRPLQIYMDEKDLARLETWSRQRGWSKSQAVRVAVRALTRARAEDPLISASGMIEGLPSDVSTDFDRYLEETFVVKASTRRTRKTKRALTRVRR
jgi:hypothetical protein